MGYILIQAVFYFCEVLIYLMLARCILSWFVRDPYTTLGKIYGFTIKLTEPIVAPCRALLSKFNTGMFDFSIFLAIIILEIFERIFLQIVVSILA